MREEAALCGGTSVTADGSRSGCGSSGYCLFYSLGSLSASLIAHITDIQFMGTNDYPSMFLNTDFSMKADAGCSRSVAPVFWL